MATDTKPTSLQTGTTPNPIPSNAQDFSGSDDEILDNFADGPDDGVPMGLGGEKGKQSEPASSTLEADIVNGTTKQPGEIIPPEDSPKGKTASDPEPVQEPAGEKGAETSPEPDSEEPETPELPPTLLQMAGYADASAAKAAGLGTPEALTAYIRGRGELLTSAREPAKSSEQPLYGRRDRQLPVTPTPETPAPPEETTDDKPFQLPAEKMDMLDEDLQAVLRDMHENSRRRIEAQQKELQSLRDSLSERENISAVEQERKDALQFDQEVQSLGEEWRDIFGEGDGYGLLQAGKTDPMARLASDYRGELFETVLDVRDDAAKKGLELNRQQEVLYALMRQFPDKFSQRTSGNSTGDSGQRRGVTASRPTQRNTPPKSQNAKALSAVNAMLKKQHGYSLDMGQEEEIEGDI